jgi:hypothetical protein
LTISRNPPTSPPKSAIELRNQYQLYYTRKNLTGDGKYPSSLDHQAVSAHAGFPHWILPADSVAYRRRCDASP